MAQSSPVCALLRDPAAPPHLLTSLPPPCFHEEVAREGREADSLCAAAHCASSSRMAFTGPLLVGEVVGTEGLRGSLDGQRLTMVKEITPSKVRKYRAAGRSLRKVTKIVNLVSRCAISMLAYCESG